MQRGVGGDQAFDIARGERFDTLLLQLPEPYDVLGLRVLGGELGRVGLQDRADAEQLGGLLLGGECTKAPWAGRRSTQPFVWSRCSASRTGWRLTPRCSASSASTRCWPGLSEPLTISSVSAS